MVTTASAGAISCFPPKPVVFPLTFPEIRNFIRNQIPRRGVFTVKYASLLILFCFIAYKSIYTVNYIKTKPFEQLMNENTRLIVNGGSCVL